MKKIQFFLLALALFGFVLFPIQAAGKKDAGGGGVLYSLKFPPT
jgi:hypothetical protein